jgi:hypothetical protein
VIVHFEILVEDQSGKRALEVIVPKILGDEHTFRVHSYKGIGRIPGNMKDARDPSKRILLANLPKLLKGYGNTFAGYDPEAVVLVCDLDDREFDSFLRELKNILDGCHPKPEARFCLAIEEGEAWLLGDIPAVKSAYANADDKVLENYQNDSICGTWETLADAVYAGGSKKLSAKGWQAVGAEKFRWAETIAPHMNIEVNKSPSFCFFRAEMRDLSKNDV